MTLRPLSFSDRIILVATLLVCVLAIAFPVKEPVMWGEKMATAHQEEVKPKAGSQPPDNRPSGFDWEKGRPVEWRIVDYGWVPIGEYWDTEGSFASWSKSPLPTLDNTRRGFVLNEKQRKIILRGDSRPLYVKETPSVSRIVFDVTFTLLCGLGAAYVSRGWRTKRDTRDNVRDLAAGGA